VSVSDGMGQIRGPQIGRHGLGLACLAVLERFPATWIPVRVKETRQIKNLEPRSDSIGTEKALGMALEIRL
jgi:hypothetical protein